MKLLAILCLFAVTSGIIATSQPAACDFVDCWGCAMVLEGNGCPGCRCGSDEYPCLWEGKRYKVGELIDTDCGRCDCKDNGDVFCPVPKIGPATGCNDGDTCRPTDFLWSAERYNMCLTFKCTRFDTYGFTEDLMSGACLYKGQCVEIGNEIKDLDACLTVSCSQPGGKGTGFITTLTPFGCRDATGKCQDVGATGCSCSA